MTVVHPAAIHLLTVGRLALPFGPLLAPLAARVVQGGLRYARARMDSTSLRA